MARKEERKAAPIITRSFASPRVRPGDTWKVYLNASHPDGEMKAIFCTLHQPGTGTYPVSIIRVPEAQGRELSGYLYLNTAGVAGLGSVNLTLKVQIQDGAEQFSGPACFPVSLNPLTHEEGPPPGVFRDREIGPIMINLAAGPGAG